MRSVLKVALAGNPISGKTTVFNGLTGARQHVGNYPGVTVERKEGTVRHAGTEMKLVDLPGTYSLTAYSDEEIVARDFIINENPDVVVDIIDASNLERNLYLAVQLMEMGAPLLLCFNMSDIAAARGFRFDLGKLSRFFGAPIVETTGHRGEGFKKLLDDVTDVALRGAAEARKTINYGTEIEKELSVLELLVRTECSASERYDARWIALKLLEDDRELKALVASPVIDAQVKKSSARLSAILGEDPETAIAGSRYGFISGACQESVVSTIESRHSSSDRIDSVVTNRVLGIPLFLGMMFLVFHLTFTVGDPLMGLIETGFGLLGDTVRGFWPQGSSSLLQSLIVDGIIGGVGGVVVFLPNILLLFLAISILEDSGYMARAAFIMDRLMHGIGLHGKSFIPMLIGFGCTVPAIMATRTLENRRDRIATMMVAPLMSCGARLPIYALIIPAFFPGHWHAPLLWIIYVTGMLLAILSAKLLRTTILKGESVPFVMELPPYRMPTLKGVLIHMWERGGLYLKKAGTIILGVSVILWALTTFPRQTEADASLFEAEREELLAANDGDEEEVQSLLEAVGFRESEAVLRQSYAGRIGSAIEPVISTMGFDWRIGTALMGAFAAKEVFVAQLGIVYSVGEADEGSETLREKLRENYSPLVALCIMLFCLISAPCMATIAVTKRESNSWAWALFQLGGLTLLAWLFTAAVFQLGTLLKIGT
jgi:ferrous iron transport protein B